MKAVNHVKHSATNSEVIDVIVEGLIEDFEKFPVKSYGLESKSAASSNFATIVADEMDLIMVAIEKYGELIACSIEDKKYVFGLNASKELFSGIHQSCLWLKVLASQGCDKTSGE